MLHNLILLLNVFIRVMQPFLQGVACYPKYAVTIASLAVGYIYLNTSCCHLYSFTSYDCPYALKIKYPVTRGYQFLLDIVFTCCCMKGLACFRYRYMSIVQIVLQGGFLAVLRTFQSFHSVCCIIPIHSVDEGIIKRVTHDWC